MASTRNLGAIVVFALGVAFWRLKSPDVENGSSLRQEVGAASKAGRSRREILISKLATAPQTLREQPDGYSLTYYDGQGSLPIAAEWMELEVNLNSFLDVSLTVLRNKGALVIRVAGPSGVKEFLRRDRGSLLKKNSAP